MSRRSGSSREVWARYWRLWGDRGDGRVLPEAVASEPGAQRQRQGRFRRRAAGANAGHLARSVERGPAGPLCRESPSPPLTKLPALGGAELRAPGCAREPGGGHWNRRGGPASPSQRPNRWPGDRPGTGWGQAGERVSRKVRSAQAAELRALAATGEPGTTLPAFNPRSDAALGPEEPASGPALAARGQVTAVIWVRLLAGKAAGCPRGAPGTEGTARPRGPFCFLSKGGPRPDPYTAAGAVPGGEPRGLLPGFVSGFAFQP